MEGSSDVPDSSDWLNTPVAPLAAVESGLRCQVCKDFFDTPMITSCSHTFCSLCIRRCLNNDGKCPTCRAADQVGKLRKNGIAEELTLSFAVARPSVIKLGQELEAARTKANLAQRSQGVKRKAGDADLESNQPPRRKRSQNYKVSEGSDRTHTALLPKNDDPPNADLQSEDDLVPCPICQEKMRQEMVFSHLDIHQHSESDTTWHPPRHTSLADRSTRPTKIPDRLPSLSYSILTDNALRKKLKELGIPSTGPRSLLITRHKEWVDLVNANCDSSRPRGKRELLNELDIWERTQGGLARTHSGTPNGGSEVMRKDFDGNAWASTHKDGFQDLIARARRKPKSFNTDTGQNKQMELCSNPVSILISSSPTHRTETTESDFGSLPVDMPANSIDA